ncbi:MAG TPA: hypothetical protein VF630_00740, partial [Hymenobacter sp.]
MNPRLSLLFGLLLSGLGASAQTNISQEGAAAQANLNSLVSGAPTVLPAGTSEGTKGSPYA